jgi:glycosyltransferase involved in cell wall biosynthesis
VELLENRDAAGRIAARGRALVVENFSWEQVAGRFVEVLESGAPLRSGKAGAAAASR